MTSDKENTATGLNTGHTKEITERGLPLEWAIANCRSVSDKEASAQLGYTAKSAGILLKGADIQVQFKPDKPWRDDKAKKAPKYRTPLGDYDAILLNHPEDPHFWNNLEAVKEKAYKIDGHPCLIIGEGFFTGMALFAMGLISVILLGVELGLTSAKSDIQGKRYLVPTLERLAKAGFGFIFCFDADVATKPGVRWAQRKLAHQLKTFKVPLFNATGLWDCDDTYPNGNKGADDYIQNHGATKFIHEVIAKCMPINEWEKLFDGPSTVDWSEPQSNLGTIGFWQSDQEGDIKWVPRCNFDFVIERELASNDGGGFVIQLKPEWDSQQYRVLIRAEHLASPDKFTSALSKALGFVVIVSLSKWELNSLIAAKQAIYRRTRGGQLFHSIDRYGQQSNGLWVFENVQFTPAGKETTENESVTVFDPALGKEDYIPCPTLASDNGTEGLKHLIAAARDVFGQDNINQFLLCCGWVIAGLHFQKIQTKEGRFPILNAYGSIGTGKTVALEAALSLIGTNWASDGMISKVTISAVYEHLSKTGSLPVIWDDPPRGDNTRELDEFCKALYGVKPRVVRGNRQTPHSPIGFTTNHLIGGEHDAAFTRFARVPFYPGGSTQAIPALKEAMKLASGSFSTLIGIGYHPTQVNAIESEILARLPLAHARIAWNLALMVFYAERLVELVGGEEKPRQWTLEQLTPIENDTENTGDPIADFIRCIQALEGKDAIGSWDKRLFTDEKGVQWVAICAGSVWSEVQKTFKPATYNQKSLKALLVKMGGIVDKPIRFYESRDEVLAYNRALLTSGCDQKGNPIKPNPPQKKMKKAWLIPLEMFGMDLVDPGIDPLDNPLNNASDDSPWSGGEYCNGYDGEMLTDIQPAPLADETIETAETVLKPNSVSLQDDTTASVSSSLSCQGNQETEEIEVIQESNLCVTDADTDSDEFSKKLVEIPKNSVSAVSRPSTTNYQGLQSETGSVSERFPSVSQVSPIKEVSSAFGQKERIEDTKSAVTLTRSDGTLIELPADYPGTRGINQTKEPRAIAKLLLAIQCRADWEAIVSTYGEIRALWVWRWHFEPSERAAIARVMCGQCEQLGVFDSQRNHHMKELTDSCLRSEELVAESSKPNLPLTETDYYRSVELNERALYLCRKSDDLVLACYLGFDSRQEADTACVTLAELGLGQMEVREAKRLVKCSIEIAIRNPNFTKWRLIAMQPPFAHGS